MVWPAQQDGKEEERLFGPVIRVIILMGQESKWKWGRGSWEGGLVMLRLQVLLQQIKSPEREADFILSCSKIPYFSWCSINIC
jgi:hypothetical protein